MHIILLIARNDTIEDGNYLQLGNELLARNHRVELCFMDSIAMLDSVVVAEGFEISAPITEGLPFPATGILNLAKADVVWTLTLGMRHSFLDKVQLLHCLSGECRLINSLEALMHFKSKYFLASHPDVFRAPATHASTNPAALMALMQDHGGKWIAKPPAGSLGRDIYLLSSTDPNARVILESMTGPEADQYCLLQPYVEEIGQGEKRVLFANGKPVGQYLRTATRDHRTNVTAGASIKTTELTSEEQAYCERIGAFLREHGALYVGMDLAFPYVIEFNVINPGGLTTLASLGVRDVASAIIDEIFL